MAAARAARRGAWGVARFVEAVVHATDVWIGGVDGRSGTRLHARGFGADVAGRRTLRQLGVHPADARSLSSEQRGGYRSTHGKPGADVWTDTDPQARRVLYLCRTQPSTQVEPVRRAGIKDSGFGILESQVAFDEFRRQAVGAAVESVRGLSLPVPSARAES